MYPSYAKLVFPSNISIDKRQENTCSFVKKKREKEKRRIQLRIKVINREDNGKWKIVEFKPIKRNLFHFGTRGTSSSIPGCSPFPEFLDPLSFQGIVRDCHEKGLGFTGEMLDLLDRDTRGRAWTCPPAHPFGLTVSYVHERLFEARDARTKLT